MAAFFSLLQLNRGITIVSNQEIIGESIREILSLLEHALKEDTLPGEPEYNETMKIFRQLEDEFGSFAGIKPQTKSATRHWNQVLKTTRDQGFKDLFRCFSALTPFLHWLNNPDYRGQNVNQAFLDNYACFELIGSQGLFYNSTVTMGVILLSPNIYYPPHTHPASECLYLLSGRGTWHISGGPIISIPLGGHILIPSGCVHAFWSMDTPLAAIYLCLGDGNQHEHPGLDLNEKI